MNAFLPTHPQWRRLLVVTVALPLLLVLAVLAFAWPAARVAPREVPVGIIGADAAAQAAVAHLTTAGPGAFDFHLYADAASAERAVRDRSVYGAFEVAPRAVTAYEASAAGPAVAQVLSGVASSLAAGGTVRTVDVVPLAATDPRGTVFSSALLPLTICGILVAASVSMLLRLRAARRQLLALAVVSSVAAFGVYLVAQGFLGVLPHQAAATWAALALAIFAISATTAGLVALVGASGLAIGAALMIFIGNPFSGATSAPELLPGAVDHLGQWLPPGAAANLLRSTAYFGGNGAGPHVAVLVAWALGGAGAIVVGHRTARGRGRVRAEANSPALVGVAAVQS